MKSSQVGRPFSQPGLKEKCFLLTRQNQTSPRGRHRTPCSACNSPGPLRCWRSHLRCSARLPTSFCPTGFCPEIWGRRPAWWCHRGLCSHCSSPCCPPFLLPSPPSTSPPALPPGLPGAGFVSGKAAAAACVRSRLDAAQLLLAAPQRPNSEKAHTEDVCFPSVDIHGSFLFSMPLLSSQDLWSQWWLACPWPAMSCMGQPRWGCHLSVVTGAWCGPSPPHATGHLSRSSVSLMRTRLPHQPGHCLGTRLCPNVASLETGTLSLSGARWCFRFPILFRDRSLLPITQRGFLPYPTTCLALRSISCLPASAFCLL